MEIKHTLTNILNTPMTRKQFLGRIGTLLLAVIGVTSLLHALTTTQHTEQTSRDSDHTTLGEVSSSPYGGQSRNG